MGQREGQKNEGDNGQVVFEMDMHCQGCAQKIKKVVRKLDGVEAVKADSSTNKLTVTGTVDAAKIKQKLEEKTNSKVKILTPLAQPKKEVHVPVAAGGTEQKYDAKPEQKKTKTPKESTVVVKIRLHCDGMKKIIMKVKGVESVSVKESKDQVTVKDTMDVNNLAAPYSGPKMELNKMEYYGGSYSQAGPSSYWYDGHAYGQNQVMDHGGYHQQGYIAHTQGGEYAYQHHDHPPVHEQQGYSYVPVMDYNNPHPPQMFSDENPNACSIM